MPKQTFVADIEKWVKKTDERMLAVLRGAILDTVNHTQEPLAKGGRMRVKTGFLRASGRASLNGMPTGNGVRPANAVDGQFQWDGEAVVKTVLSMKIGDTFTFGWVANYAEVREMYDGFMVTATQNWQTFVNDRTNAVFRSVSQNQYETGLGGLIRG